MGNSQPHLQLEHEFDFSPPLAGVNQQRQPQQAMYSANQYYQSQNSIQRNPVASSSLQGAFDAPALQQPQARSTTFGSPQTDLNGNSFMNVYGGNSHQASAQDPTSVSRFRNPNNSFRFSNNSVPTPLSLAIGSTDNGPNTNYLSTSPGPMQDTFSPPPVPNQQTHYPPSNVNAGRALPQAKRPRKQVFSDDGRDDDHDSEMTPDQKEATKAKSWVRPSECYDTWANLHFFNEIARQGACARCKTLKVRCEFKTDTDPCKRCLNGGHDCMIPGRKKRRTPP